MSLVTIQRDAHVATVRLKGPSLNAFDDDMRRALAGAVHELEKDVVIRAVVLWGGPDHFASGADIRALSEMGYEDIVTWNRELQRTVDRFSNLPMPVIAAVNGFALGGGFELALAADYRVAGGRARVGLPEVKLGIIPGAGGTQRLSALVPPSRAKELIMSGRQVPSQEALKLGLIDEVVDDDRALERSLELAQTFAASNRYALAAIKEAVDHRGGPAGFALERSLLAGLFATDDKATAMESFLRDRAAPPRTSKEGPGNGV